MQEIEDQFKQQADKQQRNQKVLETVKFAFTNAMFVALTVVLVRALLYGFWEGFNIEGLYDWGSQWAWLKYTMIGVYVAILLVVTGTAIGIIVDNVRSFRDD